MLAKTMRFRCAGSARRSTSRSMEKRCSNAGRHSVLSMAGCGCTYGRTMPVRGRIRTDAVDGRMVAESALHLFEGKSAAAQLVFIGATIGILTVLFVLTGWISSRISVLRPSPHFRLGS